MSGDGFSEDYGDFGEKCNWCICIIVWMVIVVLIFGGGGVIVFILFFG